MDTGKPLPSDFIFEIRRDVAFSDVAFSTCFSLMVAELWPLFYFNVFILHMVTLHPVMQHYNRWLIVPAIFGIIVMAYNAKTHPDTSDSSAL